MRKNQAHSFAAFLALAVSAFVGAPAAADGVSFVADTFEQYPDQGAVEGRMYVSGQGVRMERYQRGQQVVQISLPEQGLMRILFPAQRTYMETRVSKDQAAGPGAKPENPCTGLAAERCERLGSEDMGDIPAEKWRLTPEKSPGPVLVWWDPERKLSLRQEFHDGSVTQMNFLGKADYEGRPVERWEMIRVSANGEQQRAEQLMDRELGIAVREKFPGGVLRELRNIKVQVIDPSWYAVPQGYRLQQPQGQQGGQPGMRR